MVTQSITQNGQGRKPKEKFTGRNLTRFGGTGLIRRFLGQLKVDQYLQEVGTYKRRKVDYSPFEVCFSMLYAMMMGIFRPMHMVELKLDRVFQKLAGLSRFPSQSTICRFLSKITVHRAEQMAEINFRLLQKIRKGFRDLDSITLDLDSHVIPVFGSQQRASRGYNPKKSGRPSYHPLMCFIGETRDYIGGVFRPGNCHSGYKAKEFLATILKRLPGDKVKRLRADSGFFSLEFINWLMKRQIEFYVVVPQHIWVQKLILGINDWRDFDRGLSVGELRLPFPSLKNVRIVVIRQLVRKGEKPRKNLKLFSVQDVLYDYQVIATIAMLQVRTSGGNTISVLVVRTLSRKASMDLVWIKASRDTGQVKSSILNW